MKKIIGLIVAVLMFAGTAVAETDLSGMSYDELVALKDKINQAMWQSAEWQEVTVPIGVWKVGEDIPAGHWTILCARENSSTIIVVGYGVSADGKSVESSNAKGESVWYWKEVYGQNGFGDMKQWDYEFAEGMYIEVSHSNAVFTPYSGKPSLGFK